MTSSRGLVLHALNRWRAGQEFADQIIGQLLAHAPMETSDRAFVLELFYGVLRNLSLLDFWISRLRDKPLDSGSRDLLRLGLYQLIFLETAPHAAVYETVALAPERVRGLINAILRRAFREKDALRNAAENLPPYLRYSEPEFLIEKWVTQFGEENSLELCRWNNRPAPVYARINQLRVTLAQFLANHPGSEVVEGPENFVRLRDPGAAARAGEAYIQDPSTIMAGELLHPVADERVLDACAAPGGKTALLAEMMSNRGEIVACDRDPARLERMEENLVRLGVSNARSVVCDWTKADSVATAKLEKSSFDKILLDAPCSNTGVMRRRVDVRWRLRPDDFSRMAQQQLAILQAVAPFLRSGGSLVYSTCSLEPEENRAVVASFLEIRPDFALTRTKESSPFRDGFDGAFAALLVRT